MKAVLALDGGGVRGAITVAFLERLEELLGAKGRLADTFQLVGGTSTGAIIAAALSLGYSASEVRDFYFGLAPKVFRRAWWRVVGVHSRFDAAPLMTEIERVVGERTLEAPDLLTHLAIVMKQMDTGSAWVLTNNENARFWDDPADGSYAGNRHYKLKNLIRASTAAPHYFEPEPIPVLNNRPPGLFVDGGVTPHNTPALLFAMLATVPAYGFGWPLGANKLTIVSVGTGAYRDKLDPAAARRMTSAGLAVRALAGLINDGQEHALALCQWLGTTPTPWVVNEEIGTVEGGPSPLFTFLRYDVRLEAGWLEKELGVSLCEREIRALRAMDNPAIMSRAYDLGRRAADRFLLPEHVAGLASQSNA